MNLPDGRRGLPPPDPRYSVVSHPTQWQTDYLLLTKPTERKLTMPEVTATARYPRVTKLRTFLCKVHNARRDITFSVMAVSQ
jgi:hypothetical protein